jgi:hypothetical protein
MKMFENAQAGDRVYSRLHGEGEINIIHTVDWTGVYWRKEIK